MTISELKAEAKRHGYRLEKMPEYDCSCYMQYPNERHKRKNGWKCVDKYEPIKYKPKGCYSPITHCKRKKAVIRDE